MYIYIYIKVLKIKILKSNTLIPEDGDSYSQNINLIIMKLLILIFIIKLLDHNKLLIYINIKWEGVSFEKVKSNFLVLLRR